MKTKYKALLILPISLLGTLLCLEKSALGSTLFTETFDNNSQYTSNVSEFSDGSADYWTRTDGSNISIGSNPFTNPDGFFFAGQDLNGEGGSDTATLTWNSINIANFTNLSFSGFFAEDDSSDGNEDWDNGGNGDQDFVLVEYQIDSGGFQKLLAFESSTALGGFNDEPLVDTDFDGTGDGIALTNTFSQFTSNIAGTGNLFDLRITVSLDDGDEDIAFDNLTITGDSQSNNMVGVPEPLTIFGSVTAALFGGFFKQKLKKNKKEKSSESA
ncbi:MAG: PEP-CTERM sorting domain-containing protein [Moorea sp. SIO2B7]|nr:PEP-CTERM sorting domain-containing protein [Moorena sp. SIO2B7]